MLVEGIAGRGRAIAGFALPEPWREPGGGPARALEAFGAALEASLLEVACALDEARPPAPFIQRLEAALGELDEERGRLVERHGWSASQEGHAAELRDLASILGSLELASTTAEQREEVGSRGARPRLQIDPFRTKIAMRTGLAVVASLLVPMVLGWPVSYSLL